jgi:hypothetical protein
MFTWIFVYLFKNEYFNARLHDSSLLIPRLQNTLSLSSFTAATAVVINVVSLNVKPDDYWKNLAGREME